MDDYAIVLGALFFTCSSISSAPCADLPDSLEKTAHVVSPADGADPPNDFPRLVDFESGGKLEFGKGLEETRPRRAQIEKIDQRFFRRRDFPRAFSRGSMSEEQRRVDMVNGHRPQGSHVCFCPGNRNGIDDGRDLGDHPVMVEG